MAPFENRTESGTLHLGLLPRTRKLRRGDDRMPLIEGGRERTRETRARGRGM